MLSISVAGGGFEDVRLLFLISKDSGFSPNTHIYLG